MDGTWKRWCRGCERNRSARFWMSARSMSCTNCQKKGRSAASHRARVKSTYGLTPEDYAALLSAQDGACAGCGGKRGYRLSVDHDHATGLVRGLLCRRCNKVLRDVRDSRALLFTLALYLLEPPAKKLGIVASADLPQS